MSDRLEYHERFGGYSEQKSAARTRPRYVEPAPIPGQEPDVDGFLRSLTVEEFGAMLEEPPDITTIGEVRGDRSVWSSAVSKAKNHNVNLDAVAEVVQTPHARRIAGLEDADQTEVAGGAAGFIDAFVEQFKSWPAWKQAAVVAGALVLAQFLLGGGGGD